MKLIISRKGFDSSAGGCPNPILPNGELLPLPIPDVESPIKYRDISYKELKFARLVKDLTQGRVLPAHGAHLDPDLLTDSLARDKRWMPVLGQAGAAQGHLLKQGVDAGDLFLFFGLFREIEKHGRYWRFSPASKPKHVLWGWLQVGAVINANEVLEQGYHWLKYHPHLFGQRGKNNCIYVAADRLQLSQCNTGQCGAGVFKQFQLNYQLTMLAEFQHGTYKPSLWQLPAWFYPGERVPLTFHHNLSRWNLTAPDRCTLQCAARGQEFVLDTEYYPEAIPWLQSLIQ